MRLPLPLCFLILFVGDLCYQLTLRNMELPPGLSVALANGLLYSGLLWIGFRLDLARASICYLALPYFLFIPGWLNTPSAFLLSAIFVSSLYFTLSHIQGPRQDQITLQNLLAFILILLWVNLSGAGGYGYQTRDWEVHNARLHDLALLSWPVRYGTDQNLVYYVGYFLPAATIGKLTTLDMGVKSLFPWTALGVMLAIRWLGVLSQWRFSPWLVLIFMLFGPLDIVNFITLILFSPEPSLEAAGAALISLNTLDFILWDPFGFFVGNFLSNTFQLYWSPQQVVAAWLCMGLLTYLFFTKQDRSILFVFSLLCLWAPMPMLAMALLVVLAMSYQIKNRWRALCTFENIFGAVSLLGVFVVFYLGGSSNKNLSFWIFSRLSTIHHFLALLFLYLSAWGIYALSLFSAHRSDERKYRLWFLCLLLSLVLLPFYLFGDYSDLLCRGSAPLMFLLLIFLLRALSVYWHNKRFLHCGLLACLLFAGTASALLNTRVAILNYGQTLPAGSVINHKYAFENLGPDNTAFARWFRKALPAD